jgi:hypothetical protein
MAQPTNYQRVGATAFDITESGQPSCGYLSFNGSNQWMQTAAAVNFTATDEASIFLGWRKNAEGSAGVVVSLGLASGNGRWNVFAPTGSAVNSINLSSIGSLNSTNATAGSLVAGETAVFSLQSKISTDTNMSRKNGADLGSSAADQGTGNYGNYTVYFGARESAASPSNGLMFSLIARGALTSGTLLTRTEQYVARQTPTVNL